MTRRVTTSVALVLGLSLAACGGKPATSGGQTEPKTVEPAGPMPADPRVTAATDAPPALTGTTRWELAGDVRGSVVDAAIGPRGETIVAGRFFDEWQLGGSTLRSAGEEDAFVAVLDAEGRPLWARAYGGPGDDRAGAIAVDARGDLYLTGVYASSFRGDDLPRDRAWIRFGATKLTRPPDGFDGDFIVKLAGADGTPRWATYLPDGPRDSATCNELAVLADRLVVGCHFDDAAMLAGGERASAGSVDVLVARLDQASGAVVWASVLGGMDVDRAGGIALDAAGDVAIAGVFGSSTLRDGDRLELAGAGGKANAFVAKLDGARGTTRWAHTFAPVGETSSSHASDVGFAPDGTLRVIGGFHGTARFRTDATSQSDDLDDFLVALSSTGELLWQQTFGTPSSDTCHRVAVDRWGGAIVQGHFFGGGARIGGLELPASGSSTTPFVARFDHTGAIAWLRATGNDIGASSDEQALAVGLDGSVVVGGGRWRESQRHSQPILEALAP